MDYSIGEFSAVTQLSRDTLRYYEKERLIVVGRDAAGRRRYTEGDIGWISFIRRLKETGMHISDIKTYAQLRYKGDGTMRERMEILKKHRIYVLSQKEKWESNLKHLDEKIRIYKGMIDKRDTDAHPY